MSEQKAPYIVEGHDQATFEKLKSLPCALPFSDPGYIPPDPDQLDALIKAAGWSQNDVAKLVGVGFNPKKGSTTVRKWRSPVGSSEHREIPYAAWRLLLIYAGVVSEVKIIE